MTHRRLVTLALAAALTIGACGGDPPRELAGYRREPAPLVGDLSLPDLTEQGTDLSLRAEPGHLLVVYFGYTNCPDFCPTTLSDLKLAMRRMDADDAARIDVAMVTVDPVRERGGAARLHHELLRRRPRPGHERRRSAGSS